MSRSILSFHQKKIKKKNEPLLRREGNTKHKKIDVRRHETHALHRFMDYNLKGKQILKGKEKGSHFHSFLSAQQQ